MAITKVTITISRLQYITSECDIFCLDSGHFVIIVSSQILLWVHEIWYRQHSYDAAESCKIVKFQYCVYAGNTQLFKHILTLVFAPSFPKYLHSAAHGLLSVNFWNFYWFVRRYIMIQLINCANVLSMQTMQTSEHFFEKTLSIK